MARTTLYKCGNNRGESSNPYYGIAPANTDLSRYFKEPGFAIIRFSTSAPMEAAVGRAWS